MGWWPCEACGFKCASCEVTPDFIDIVFPTPDSITDNGTGDGAQIAGTYRLGNRTTPPLSFVNNDCSYWYDGVDPTNTDDRFFIGLQPGLTIVFRAGHYNLSDTGGSQQIFDVSSSTLCCGWLNAVGFPLCSGTFTMTIGPESFASNDGTATNDTFYTFNNGTVFNCTPIMP